MEKSREYDILRSTFAQALETTMVQTPEDRQVPKRMQARGYKAITVYLKKSTANVLKLYCGTLKRSQSEFLGELAEQALKKEGLIE